MPNQPAEAFHCKRYLINCFIHPLTASLLTTWEQVRRFNSGLSIEEVLLEDALHCKQYLINCFVHPLTAARFTNWVQVRLLESGFSVNEALNMQREYDQAAQGIIGHATTNDEFV